jgi:hypothetical protein
MRELVITEIKEYIDWKNSFNDSSEKYPDFDNLNDAEIFKLYKDIPKGPCG